MNKIINLKTIYFNFKYLPFRQALKFPVLISNNVFLLATNGRLHFSCPIRYGLVQIGYGNVGIFDKKKSRAIWEVYGDVTFSGNTILGHGSKIVVGLKGKISFGKNFKITAESSIVAYHNIQFGNNCLISWDILFMDTDFHTVKNEAGEIINNPEPLLIGDHVWVGCRSIILKGAIIPNNTIIATNSLVNKELIQENCIYGGSPVKCIKEKITWEE